MASLPSAPAPARTPALATVVEVDVSFVLFMYRCVLGGVSDRMYMYMYSSGRKCRAGKVSGCVVNRPPSAP